MPRPAEQPYCQNEFCHHGLSHRNSPKRPFFRSILTTCPETFGGTLCLLSESCFTSKDVISEVTAGRARQSGGDGQLQSQFSADGQYERLSWTPCGRSASE